MSNLLPPYPAYKLSGIPWIPEIPEHWNVLPGRAIFDQKKTLNSGMQESQVLSLSYGHLRIRHEDELHGLVPASFETYQLIEPDDIVCRPTDLQNDWTSLRFGLSTHRGIITSAYICLRTTPTVTPRFGHLLLHAYDLKKVFYGLGSGLRQNLGWTDFKHLPCVTPPAEEQAAIVRYLDHADELINRYISAKERLIALLEEQRQAVIHQAVTRGLDPDAPLKPSGLEWLGEVPAHWGKRRLKEVATIQAGITVGPDNGRPGLTERPYLRVANVQAGHLDLSHVTKIRVSPTEIKRSTLQVGDVLMTEGGDIDKLGRGCIWQGQIPDCLHQNHVFAVRPDPAFLNPEFLVAVMGSVHGRTYFYLTAKQTTNLAATNRTTLGNLPIHLPSVSEQLNILNHVEEKRSAADKAINQAQQQISLVNEYRTRLIADAVTGQVDVREATVGVR